MTFIEKHGLVRYTQDVGLKRLHSGQPCEGCGKASAGLDHCHVHGWVRGTLCGRCNHAMHAIDARKSGNHASALLAYWQNCPGCAVAGPWAPGEPPMERPHRPRKISLYLPDDLHAAWKASGVPLGELVRRGLDVGREPLTEDMLRRVIREMLP